MLILAARTSRNIQSCQNYIRRRSYKNFDESTFKSEVRNIKWLDLYLCNDVNEAVKLFTSKLLKILDVMAPMRQIQIRGNYNPSLSTETKSMIHLRNELHKIAADSQLNEDWYNYKQMRNQLTNRMKYEKKQWQCSRLRE